MWSIQRSRFSRTVACQRPNGQRCCNAKVNRFLAAAPQRTGVPPPWQFLREGKAADQILAAAREWEADVIVIGTHGRTGVSRIVLGSTAESVVRHGSCPVLVMPGADLEREAHAIDAMLIAPCCLHSRYRSISRKPPSKSGATCAAGGMVGDRLQNLMPGLVAVAWIASPAKAQPPPGQNHDAHHCQMMAARCARDGLRSGTNDPESRLSVSQRHQERQNCISRKETPWCTPGTMCSLSAVHLGSGVRVNVTPTMFIRPEVQELFVVADNGVESLGVASAAFGYRFRASSWR
jgi:universal stress protein family protein